MSGAGPRYVVLGAGRVGSLIALDLARDDGALVRSVDRSPRALERLAARGIETAVVDLSDPARVRETVASADVVIGAVPGAMGLAALRAAVEAGRPAVDISFMPEPPWSLDAAAHEHGIPVVVDCGVAPGLSNWFVGAALAALDEPLDVEILVGGLPTRRVWPFDYRSVFSPTDVIEEYTRPCRMRIGGVEVVVPALSGVEPIDDRDVGTLEAFNTDGLRSLLKTVAAPNLREKTMRWPGHAERMRMLRDSGFFDETPREVGGTRVAPRAMTEALLFDAWTPAPDEDEFTLLLVCVEGLRDGARRRERWRLFDRTDHDSGTSSMARTTGFPCAIVARMIADGRWSRPGVVPPETLGGDPALTRAMLDELDRRGVRVERTTD